MDIHTVVIVKIVTLIFYFVQECSEQFLGSDATTTTTVDLDTAVACACSEKKTRKQQQYI